ncbi:MAG TPA: hypothetical protein VFZ44_14230, partial [Pyrinomonadaceae bacterium]
MSEAVRRIAEEPVRLYVDNSHPRRSDHDSAAGRRPEHPLATADEAFRRLPPYWRESAEIIFADTGSPYRVTTDAVYFGMPLGPEATPLVIRGGYSDVAGVLTARDSAGEFVDTLTRLDVRDDELVGAVLKRLSSAGTTADSPVGTAVSIRGNGPNPHGTSRIYLQRTVGRVSEGDTFLVQRPSVWLEPAETLNLTSHDGRSLNLTLIGIGLKPAAGKGLNFHNVRAQCDTCELVFNGAGGFVHSYSRLQGGIAEATLAPDPSDLPGPTRRSLRAQAGVFVQSNAASNFLWAARGGVLGGHLTFKKINVRVSQGGVFIPQSLEALEAPIHIMGGGTAVVEPQLEGRAIVGGWGRESNRARIRNVRGADGDGLRVSNGGSVAAGGPIFLDVSGCERDGVRLDDGALASFGLPGGLAGLVTAGAPNGAFGMNVRNASRALVGRDAVVTGG